MKKNWLFFVALFLCLLFAACSKEDNNENTGNGISVIIDANGIASNGSLFSAIDDKNFYLDYIKYTVEEGHLVVTGYDEIGFKGHANIVSSISYKGNSYEVLEIKNEAFLWCDEMTTLTIPNSVTVIGDQAFASCHNLTSVTIPYSVKKIIGYQAFASCDKLASIIVDKNNLFYDSRESCNAIIETATNTLIAGSSATVIPNSVKTIGEYAFSKRKGLTSITIPSNVKTIGEYAFRECDKLKSVNIISDIAEFGEGTFYECSNLTSINLPDSITQISEATFQGCKNLTSIIIPNSVTSIGNNAFSGCQSLTSIILPDSITSLGSSAFWGCQSLKDVTIPDGIKTLGWHTFDGCSGLTSVTIGRNMEYIAQSAFNGCINLTDVYCIGTSPSQIYYDSFDYNTRTSVTVYVPQGTKSIYEETEWGYYFRNIIEQ